MDRATRKAVLAEFRKYYRMVKVFGYKPIKPWTSPIDWWILNSLYGKKNKRLGDTSGLRSIRHYCRLASAEKGTNQNKIYVFMTHIVDADIARDGTLIITTHLNWKYSPTPDPLDTIETSVSGTSLIDDFIPRDPERDIEPIESSFEGLKPPSVSTIGYWARLFRRLRFIRNTSQQ